MQASGVLYRGAYDQTFRTRSRSRVTYTSGDPALAGGRKSGVELYLATLKADSRRS
jgi:hypothetical protein